MPIEPRRKVQRSLVQNISELEAGPVPETAPATPDAERQQITVLFADLTDFIKLSGKLDAEEIYAHLNC